MKQTWNWLAVAAVALSALPATASEDGFAIIEKVRAHPAPKSSAVQLKMTLINEKRSTPEIEERTATIIGKDTEEGAMSRLRFESPSEIKGVGLLVIARDNADNDQWLFMPALGKSTRIAGAAKQGSFMGTDFTYEDLEPRAPEAGNHKVLREETYENHPVWVVESVAKDPKSSNYSRVIQWIRKDVAIPIKAEFYDKQGKLHKVLNAEDVREENGYWTARKTTMHDVRKKHKTVMEILQQRNDIELPDAEFTQRALTRQ